MANANVAVESKELKVIPRATDIKEFFDDEDTAEAFEVLDEQYGMCEGGMAYHIGNLCGFIGKVYKVKDTKKKFAVLYMDVPATFKSLRDGNIIEGAIFQTNKGKVYISVEWDVWTIDEDGDVDTFSHCVEV